MMTKTPIGHRAASAVRPAVIDPSTGFGRLRLVGLVGGASVRRYAPGAPTSLAGTPSPVLRRVCTT